MIHGYYTFNDKNYEYSCNKSILNIYLDSKIVLHADGNYSDDEFKVAQIVEGLLKIVESNKRVKDKLTTKPE